MPSATWPFAPQSRSRWRTALSAQQRQAAILRLQRTPAPPRGWWMRCDRFLELLTLDHQRIRLPPARSGASMSEPTPRTPYSAIITALKNVTVLQADDAERIAREFVMVEVMHIRNAADQMRSELSAKSAEVERLKENLVGRTNRADALEEILAKANERAAQAKAEKEALRVALAHTKKCLEEANESGVITDTIWAGPAETLFDYIDAARQP